MLMHHSHQFANMQIDASDASICEYANNKENVITITIVITVRNFLLRERYVPFILFNILFK
ncbi:hypothetical protein, partial [Staphylococcus aureus]|uniref:hypothetical protein n=1 Tax=Staphylococcus aureus TaxID=1280 RepID=UPI0039BE46F0